MKEKEKKLSIDMDILYVIIIRIMN